MMNRVHALLDGNRGKRAEAGFTMVELMVALTIFSIFLAVVLSSIVSITRASTNVQVISQSASATLSVFQRLDRELRYADSINYPGTGGSGDMYVEFRTPATSASAGVTLCTQWRYDLATHTLSHRFWNDGSAPAATFQTDLTNMVTDSTSTNPSYPTYPFKLLPASNATNKSIMQELVVSLATGTGAKGAAITSTFVARNSSTSSPSNHDDITPGTSDIPICPGGTRQ